MSTPPKDFNEPSNRDESKSCFDKSSKKVKFDRSVDIQQRQIKEEREHQKRIQAELDEKLMKERIEQLKIDEMFREANGIPFFGNFDSPVPKDPFQKHSEATNFGNSSPSFNFQQSLDFEEFNSSIAAHQTSPNFSSSNAFNSSKPHIKSSYKMKSTIHKSSHYSSPLSNNGFSTSKRFSQSKSQFGNSVNVQPSSNLNSSRLSGTFRASFKSSNNSRNVFNNSYKTALCIKFKDNQECSYGKNCRYAHGLDELRPPSNYPLQITCKYFLQNLPCPFDQKCKFRHQ